VYYFRVKITVFGKHCECNAQKCTHLKSLTPLGSHLLMLSHCVLTKHGGQKNHMTTAGNRSINTPEREHASANYDKVTRMNSKPDESSSQHARCWLIKVQITTARPYESCKILKGRPRRNVYSKLVYYQYKSFPADRSVRRKSKNQLGWVINPVQHNLVRRIRFWRIKSPQHDLIYLYWTRSKMHFWDLFTCKGTYMIDWVGRLC